MASRDTQRYMKNVNKLFGPAKNAPAGKQQHTRTLASSSRKVSSAHRVNRLRESVQQTVAGGSCLSARKKPPSNRTNQSNKRIISWQCYEQIFLMMDDLKYQFPALGYERFFDMFTELFKFYSNCGIYCASDDTNDEVTQIDEKKMKWVSSFGIDPAYYGRLMEADLYERVLLPVFGAAHGQFDPVILEKVTVNGRNISSSFLCNNALSRLVKCTRVELSPLLSPVASAVVCELAKPDLHDGNGNDEGNMASAAYPSVSAVETAAAFITKKGKVRGKRADGLLASNPSPVTVGSSRQRDVSTLVKQDAKRYQAHLSALGIETPEPMWCECCCLSYRIVLTFGDNDEGCNWREYYRSIASPAVYINAQILLSWALSSDDFSRDFILAKPLKTDESHQSRSFMHKTLTIYKMGFYKRIYSLHLWVYFIVMWLWTCHRAVHTGSGLSCAFAESVTHNRFVAAAFPVQLLVQKKLRKIFEDVPSLPLSKLLKTRKLFIQYV